MPKKDPGQFTLFPETLYEYHILLSPGGSVIEDVDNLKQQLDSMIGLAPHNLSSIAHITLHNFVAYESVNVKDDVKKAVAGLKSFTIKLAGHAHFEQGRERTLYLKIDNPQPIDALAERIISPKKARKEAVRQTSILDNPRSKPKAPKSSNPTLPLRATYRWPTLSVFLTLPLLTTIMNGCATALPCAAALPELPDGSRRMG